MDNCECDWVYPYGYVSEADCPVHDREDSIVEFQLDNTRFQLSATLIEQAKNKFANTPDVEQVTEWLWDKRDFNHIGYILEKTAECILRSLEINN